MWISQNFQLHHEWWCLLYHRPSVGEGKKNGHDQTIFFLFEFYKEHDLVKKNFTHFYLYYFVPTFFQMTSSDKDFRFMATNDLMSELQKDSIKLDDESEGKVVRMLLKLLEDKNGEVQNLAVRW